MDIERTMEFLLEQQAAHAAAMAEFDANMDRMRRETEERSARADREIAAIRNQLRRAIRASVLEARAERKKRKEEDEKLAALHAATERSLKQFIDSMNQPRNGHDKAH